MVRADDEFTGELSSRIGTFLKSIGSTGDIVCYHALQNQVSKDIYDKSKDRDSPLDVWSVFVTALIFLVDRACVVFLAKYDSGPFMAAQVVS